MKRYLILFAFIPFLFSSCSEEEAPLLTETGIVIDYAGAGECDIVIELDNGNRIQPLYYPSGFVFSQGQRVLVDYAELNNIKSSCDRGIPCEISYVEELSCAAYVDLYFENYDSLARDPVHIHEAFMDRDCLHILISYPGGCEEHTLDLARMHPWTASSSTVPTFEIRHNANDDLCEAWLTQDLSFDLSELKSEGIKEFVLTAKLLDGEVYNKIFDLN